jgi:hypothetical protein
LDILSVPIYAIYGGGISDFMQGICELRWWLQMGNMRVFSC